MNRALVCIVMLAIVAGASCKKGTTPAPPSTGGTAEPVSISGRERIAWDQSAASVSDLAQLRYAIYVDNVRSLLQGALCSETGVEGQFECTAALPPLAPGEHVLEIATYPLDSSSGSESARSPPLRVIVQASAVRTSQARGAADSHASDEAADDRWSPGAAGVTDDGLALRVERVADGLVDPVDLAVAPDGRVFVAERSGRLHVLDTTHSDVVAAPVEIEDGQLLAIALDPAFTRTHAVYALYAAPAAEGWTYRIARFREVAGVLGERAVIVNAVLRTTDPQPAPLRLTTDGHILVATPSTDLTSPTEVPSSSTPAPRRPGTPSPRDRGTLERSGTLLRFTAEGATPGSQRGSPVAATGLHGPAAAAWDSLRSSAWIVGDETGGASLIEVGLQPREAPRRVAAHRLPSAPYRSIAVCETACWPGFQSNLLLASDGERHILRVRMGQDTDGPVATERLLQDRVGGILLVSMAPDGHVYFATRHSVGRLSAQH